MIQVKCINKLRDKQNIIQYYTLVDRQGNQKTVTAEALKRVIRNNQLECINLTLTSDNRLIDKNIKTVQKPVQSQPPKTKLEMYNAYKAKTDMLSINPAEYRVEGDDIILTKVNIKTGTFTIPPFVTKIDTARMIEPICVFKDCIDIKLINKSNITDMSGMFSYCKNLQRLDLSNFDTSKVTDMHNMFFECISLQSLDLSNLDTSKVTDMQHMFWECRNLQSLDLSNFDTSQVTDMCLMFSNCRELKNLDLSSFDTSKVTDMHDMFSSCKALHSLDLSNFDTSQVTDMHDMFFSCNNLQSLDLSNFDTSQVTNMRDMFYGCYHKDKFKLSSNW